MTARKTGSFFSQVLIYGSGLALNYGIGFILLPIYSRLMPTEQYGILEILNRTIEIVSLLLLTQYGITYIRFYRDKSDADYRRRVTSTSIYVVVGVAAIVAIVLAALRLPLSELLFDTKVYGHYIVLVAVRYVLDMSFVVPFLYFQATEQPGKYIAISASRFAFTLILNLVLLTMMDDKVAAVLWAQIISISLFVLVVGIPVFVKSICPIDTGLSKDILKFTWSFSFLGLYAFVISSGDRFMLNEYCGKAEVGVYSAGYRIAQVLSVFIFSPILRAWSPRMIDQLRSEEGPRQLAKLTTYSMLLYCSAGLALAIYSRELVSVFVGEQYYVSYSIIPIIVFGYLFQGFSTFVDGGIYYSKKTHWKIWHWITTIICIGLYFLLIPKYCGVGAAWASVGAFVVLAVINWYIAVRAYPMKYELGKLAAMAALGVALYLANYLFESLAGTQFQLWLGVGQGLSPWLHFAIMIVIKFPLLLIFVGGVYLMRIVEPEDRARARELLKSLKEKVKPDSREDLGLKLGDPM